MFKQLPEMRIVSPLECSACNILHQGQDNANDYPASDDLTDLLQTSTANMSMSGSQSHVSDLRLEFTIESDSTWHVWC